MPHYPLLPEMEGMHFLCRDVLGFSIVFDNIILVELEPAPNVRIGLMDISRTKLNVTAPETIVFSFRVTNGKNL